MKDLSSAIFVLYFSNFGVFSWIPKRIKRNSILSGSLSIANSIKFTPLMKNALLSFIYAKKNQ